MVNQQLLDYIKQQLQQGASKEQIKSSLLANSWQAQDIEEAFNSFSSPAQPFTPSNVPSQSFSPQPHRGLNKTLLAIISIIGGILIIGGGVFAYFNYFQSPEKIVQKMAVKLTEIKSLEYSGEIKTEISAGNLLGGSSIFLQPTQQTSNKKESNFSINFTGSSDIQNPNNLKDQFSFNVKTDALSQGEFAFGLEVKIIDKIIYIKLSDVPNLGFFDLSAVKNQWIKIDTEALKKQFGLEKLEEQIKEAQKKQELTPEQIEKLKTAVQQAKIFKITEKLASEKIEGVNTYHYKFTIDKTGIKKLFTDISQIIQNKTLTEKELTDFDKGLEKVELPEGEIWIGKKDLLPYKITLSSIIKETDKSKISGKVSFTLLLKNFNKPVQIDIPQQAKPLEEFLGGLFGGLQGLTPGGAVPSAGQQDFNKDTDKDGLPDQLETIYGTNPNKADTDGDGFKDGEEIEKGYNPNGPGKLF